MTTQVASGWDLLNSFDGATPITIAYAAPKTAYLAGRQNIVLLVSAGFTVVANTTPETPVVQYGNVVGTAKITKVPWTGSLTTSVYWLTCYIPLDTYDGVSNVLSINFSGGDPASLDGFVNSVNRGAFGLVLYNVPAALNPNPLGTIQVHPDVANPADIAVTLSFTTGNGDYLIGQGFLNVTGGALDVLAPSGASASVQQISATGAGSHAEGAMKALYKVCSPGVTGLSFGASGTGQGSGFRVIFGGFIVKVDSTLIPSTRPKWVQFGRAIRLPHILGGRGKFQHEKQALQTFITEARTNKVFAKYIAGASHGDSNIRVDVNHPSVSIQPVDATTFTDTVQ